jgi:predicted transcriptional regulator
MNQLSTQTTTKKVKVVGKQQYLNTNTGELEEFQVTDIEERDFNFSKVWIRNFVATLDIVGNQKTRLVYWIIDHLNRENQLIATNRQMVEQTNISLQTVSVTMKALQDANFLRRSMNGVYTINPDIVFKGSKTARLNILNRYQELDVNEKPEISREEQIANLQKTIETLQKQLAALTNTQPTADIEAVAGQMRLMPDGAVVDEFHDK